MMKQTPAEPPISDPDATAGASADPATTAGTSASADPAAISPAARTAGTRLVARVLTLSALITIGVAGFLGFASEPFWFAFAAVGAIEIVLARLWAAGVIGPTARERRRAEATGDAGALAAEAQADPEYNPYARED